MPTTTINAGSVGAGTGINSGTDGSITFKTGATAGAQIDALTLSPAGVVSLIGQVVSASTTNTVTNKVAISINGTTYYLLASTSGA